jgi:hypothetical protein
MLLVHGFLATPHVFRWLAARLGRSGYCVHGVDLGGLFGRFNARPIEELAHVVAERVRQLARDHPCERIDLVGHSAGGLIGRYYVQKLDGARHVRHLVTLGTPHRGTRWAYPGHLVRRVLPSLRQMAPGSPLLRDLADDDFPAGVRLTSVYSRRDSICPPSSCRLEIGQAPHLRNVEVTRGGHLELLLSAKISSIVRRELESEELLFSTGPAGGDSQRLCHPLRSRPGTTPSKALPRRENACVTVPRGAAYSARRPTTSERVVGSVRTPVCVASTP